MEHSPRLAKHDWLRAARLALIRGGPDAVRVEPLARDLKVTKGSFYWHFRDRDQLLEALLCEWEGESETLCREAAARGSARDAVAFLGEYLQRSMSSSVGEYPPDVGIYNWAAVCPRVNKRVARIERLRIDMFTTLTQRPDHAELAYLVWLGFIFRCHRAPATREEFPLMFGMVSDLLLGRTAKIKTRRTTKGNPK
jgi:AcrR family transcriptional regulator